MTGSRLRSVDLGNAAQLIYPGAIGTGPRAGRVPPLFLSVGGAAAAAMQLLPRGGVFALVSREWGIPGRVVDMMRVRPLVAFAWFEKRRVAVAVQERKRRIKKNRKNKEEVRRK